MRSKTTLIIAIAVFLLIGNSIAQETSNNFKEQFLGQFNYASRVLELAKAMPAESYDWRPMDGVSSVQEVYTHIARYNFYYPQNSLGIPAPDDLNLDAIESITGKEEVVAILERSINHLKEAVNQMPVSKLSEQTELYGRTVDGQAVLMQLITHMSEHVGQSIAYARMNEVVPPWNR
ncbi:DinB family protein [Aliifodinibius sp. S!AR15-10]|uniref:DinB family protein n=1 Tax=Aliifodinibius sp. S!AR15-10 TaxID=2950437 RepID=UPI0028609CB7|nr:DinB family protein [Aliifodinibius sp. S!AR15-10]MDR8392447.1 DinB family protein [Aliifodinibius sp. S!AR15-10]